MGGARRAHRDRAARALLDPRTGLFFDLAGRAEHPIKVSTWSSLAPARAARRIPRDVRERLVDEHLLNPRRYRARFGVPSVSMEEPSFRPGFNAYRTWRGAAWMNTTWLLAGGLRVLGADDEADDARAASRTTRSSAAASASTTTRAPAAATASTASASRRCYSTSAGRG